ncbi:Mg2+ transporter like zinc transport [Fusarium sp. NRRL 52700]|nr:Mg2+ transporter like zinc transport [Fusarium sp. NRRL 52700]
MDYPQRTCTYSFGDNGTTATVSPSGRLLRMSKYFPGHKTGYCVDHESVPQPYVVVDRITAFLESINEPDHNIGFYPHSNWLDSSDESASVTFINDRWPVFNLDGNNVKVEIQYYVSDGAVYQTFRFAKGRPPMTLMPNSLIRELDFCDDNHGFNKAEATNSGYETKLGDNANWIERSHKNQDTHVCLFISACIGGRALVFEKVENENGQNAGKAHRFVLANGSASGTTGPASVSSSAEITFVYALKFIDAKSPELPPTTVKKPKAPKIPRFFMKGEGEFTDNSDLNQLLRRNLEHILSVCSIPMHNDGNGSTEPAIALTCGEVDDHRVATAASFYCFQFLLLALKHFEFRKADSKQNDPVAMSSYGSFMVQRIRKVLKGHLNWIFSKDFRDLAHNPSCPHTWLSGKEITGWEENIYLPPASLVDAPFHLIKAGDFYAYDMKWEVPKAAKGAVKAWIKELEPKNKLGSYAFPRDMENPTHYFYLTDHVLIWRAVKSAELLGLTSELSADILQEEEEVTSQPKKAQRKRDYSSGKIQNQILKRFATENPVSRRRMLAVSRSPGHARFLLRTRDTSLFHAMESKLFDKPGTEPNPDDEWQNKIDIWKRLVECQQFREDNDDTSWDEPLRFALLVIMGHKGKSMNSRSLSESHNYGISVLIERAWPNGLFPGQYDVDNQPAVYDDEFKRDKYWGNTFEIPYILWKYAKCSKKEEPDHRSPSEAELSIFRKGLLDQNNPKSLNMPSSGSMKLSFQYNNIVDQTNIVQLSDEWLYNIPDFFNYQSNSSHTWMDKIDNLIVAMHQQVVSDSDLSGVLIDVPRPKLGEKKPPTLDEMQIDVQGRNNLRDLMRDRRLPSKAKKRLVMLYAVTPFANIAYPQTESETASMLSFYHRHTLYDNYFFEHTALETNRWTTEFHLSFNALYPTMPTETTEPKRRPSLEKIGLRRLKKVVMSFRFDGDFFDRYWTCFFLNCNPQKDCFEKKKVKRAVEAILWNERQESSFHSNVLGDKKESWQQRRILELLIFQEMIDRMHNCTEEILKDSNQIIDKNHTVLEDLYSATADLKLKDFDASRQRIQKHLKWHQQRLQIVEQDMAQSFVHIELWLSRERDRHTEQPRWTFNDEIKYRTIIPKLLVQGNHKVQEIRHSQARLRKMLEKLDRELERQDREREAKRSEVDRARAADIQRFTYVTVIFLPLGFATGVFSMSGAPDGETLRNMIFTALGAFLVTITLIICATSLGSIRELLARLLKGHPKEEEKTPLRSEAGSGAREGAEQGNEDTTRVSENENDNQRRRSRRSDSIPV